ncbi:MAG: lipopolysaccharide heptosyltransferase II [Candidatus Cloacimonetes bacterium]|nr:lipopolysaccharide heptosyltransferase II [Candidatus Cloacimonadota bacterium]
MKKILIIRLSSLGDIVLTQSAVQAIRDEYPQAQIHYLTKKEYAPIIEMFNCVDQIHYWEKKRSLLIQLRKIRFDLTIDLHSKFNTLIIKCAVNAKKTITYKKQHWLRLKIVKKLTNRTISSTVELYFSVLRKLQIEAKVFAPRLYLSGSFELPEPSSKLTEKKMIGLFPGALHNTKQYPIQKFAEFIDSVPAEWNCEFVIFGSDKEKQIADQLEFITKTKLIDLCGQLDLIKLINVISKLDVVITNDSGPMHIAAALSRPQIAIFCSTHPKLGFKPLNKNAITLSSDISCQPCSLHGNKACPLKHYNCMKEITPSQILDSLEYILF